MRSRSLAFCAFVFSVAVLAACGGSSEESDIAQVVESSFTNTDPASCTRLNTPLFMTQMAQEGGAGAVRACESEAEEGEGAEAASVSNVEDEFSTATAEVTLTGTEVLDGQPLMVELVKRGERWKMNNILKFAKFDQAKLVRAFKAEFARRSSDIGPKLAACYLSTFRVESQVRIEEALFGYTPQAFDEIAKSCKLRPEGRVLSAAAG